MKKLDIITNRKVFLTIPCVIIVAIILFAAIFGVKMDISFKGGTMITYSYDGKLKLSDVTKNVTKEYGNVASTSESVDSLTNTKTVIVNVPTDVQTEQLNAFTATLQKEYPDNKIEVLESTSVEASVGSEFFGKCLVAIIFASLLMILYIGLRFKNIGGVRAGICCVAALVHDMMIVFGVFVFARLPLNGNFVAAMLTILGYSINNTIVIYDRVRENKTLYGKKIGFEENINLSVNQSVTRSVHTTTTTVIALLIIGIAAIIFGIDSIVTFALPLIIGMIAGLYSSLCISGSLWALWNTRHPKKAKA